MRHFEDVLVCDLVLMALPLSFLSLSTEHVVVFYSAVLAIVNPSVCPSVRPSVCHMLALCENDSS